MHLSRSARTRLLKKVEGRGSQKCWPWHGSTVTQKNGAEYPVFSVEGVTVSASRLIFELYNSKLRPGEVIHHKCEKLRCVNPFHMEAMQRSLFAEEQNQIRHYRAVKEASP